MRRLFAMVLLAAPIVFVISVRWPPKTVLWIRQLGGKLNNACDRDDPKPHLDFYFQMKYIS
jgi:hypothetical protein